MTDDSTRLPTWFDFFSSVGGLRQDELFHYTTGVGLIGIVDTGKLWASDYRFSNDASEIREGIELIKSRTEPLLVGEDPDVAHTFRLLISDHLDSWMDQLTPYLFCMSGEKPDRLSQWRAYGPEGNGYAIGFRFEKLERLVLRGVALPPTTLTKVEYDHAAKLRRTDEILRRLIEQFREAMGNKSLIDEAVDRLIRFCHFLASSFKNSAFQEEEEYRLVFAGSSDLVKHLHFSQRGGIAVPHHTVCSAENGLLPITQVLVGPHRYMDEAKRGVNLLLQKNGYKDIPVYPSDVPFREL